MAHPKIETRNIEDPTNSKFDAVLRAMEATQSETVLPAIALIITEKNGALNIVMKNESPALFDLYARLLERAADQLRVSICKKRR